MTVVEYPVLGKGRVLVSVRPEHDETISTRQINIGSAVHKVEQTLQAEEDFDSALTTIHTVAQGVLAQLDKLTCHPDEVHVEFKLEVTAKLGAVLASAEGAAHLRVELTWRPSRP